MMEFKKEKEFFEKLFLNNNNKIKITLSTLEGFVYREYKLKYKKYGISRDEFVNEVMFITYELLISNFKTSENKELLDIFKEEGERKRFTSYITKMLSIKLTRLYKNVNYIKERKANEKEDTKNIEVLSFNQKVSDNKEYAELLCIKELSTNRTAFTEYFLSYYKNFLTSSQIAFIEKLIENNFGDISLNKIVENAEEEDKRDLMNYQYNFKRIKTRIKKKTEEQIEIDLKEFYEFKNFLEEEIENESKIDFLLLKIKKQLYKKKINTILDFTLKQDKEIEEKINNKELENKDTYKLIELILESEKTIKKLLK